MVGKESAVRIGAVREQMGCCSLLAFSSDFIPAAVGWRTMPCSAQHRFTCTVPLL